MKIILFLFLFFVFAFLEYYYNRNYFLDINNGLRALQINNKLNTNENNKELTSSNIKDIINENKNENSNFKRKNLIIGAIIYYEWEKMSTFFKSYIRAGFENCEIVMFVRDISQETLSKMKSYGIIIYDIPDKFKKMPISNYRWKIYEDYLSENKNKYNLVFTGDIRDTFFQTDLFNFYEKKNSFLGIAIEDGILSNKYNKKWLISLYGEDSYRAIEHERIVCIGTVWGTVDKMIDFTRMMWENLSSEKALRVNAFDQAPANYIIYINKTFDNCLVKSDNKNGPVMTIDLTNITDIHFDSENNILNRNGEIAAVIHQYDRKEEIIKILNEALTKPLKITYKKKLLKYPLNYILYISLSLIFSIVGIFFFRLRLKKKRTLKAKINSSSYTIIKYSNYITNSVI